MTTLRLLAALALAASAAYLAAVAAALNDCSLTRDEVYGR